MYTPAHAVPVADRKLLGHPSTHGRAVDVDLVDAEFVEDRDDVLGDQLGAVGVSGLSPSPVPR